MTTMIRIVAGLPIACLAAGLLSAQLSAQQPPAGIAPGAKKVNAKDGMTYVWIPPGKFMMGCSPGDAECGEDEKPVHQVTLTKGFWLGQTAVTQQAYEKVTGKNPANHKGADLPVEEVDWNEAQAYCVAIGGRLPTEAEYEYATRAGSTAARYGNLDDIAWYNTNSGGASHEVATKPPNAFGLYDMMGNTWQWVADWYGKYTADPQVDPTGPATGELKEPKGGSWGTQAKSLRASHRDTVEPGHRGNKLGMRCVSN
jgi:formylglycine-generating enzyme required for sulfatase activity